MDYYTEERDAPDRIENLYTCNTQSFEGCGIVVGSHVHEYFELLYCLDGSYEIYVNGKYFNLTKGDLALIDPMDVHQTRSTTDGLNRYVVLKFVPDVLFFSEKPLFELKYLLPYIWVSQTHRVLFPAEMLDRDSISDIVLEILHEYEGKEYGYEMACRITISRFFLWVLRKWHEECSLHTCVHNMDDSTLLLLQKAFEFIDANHGQDLTMEQVAQVCNMSYTSFSRFFSKYAQQSFPEYLTNVRLKKASVLLTTTGKSITDVAMDVGFSTTSYFIQRFRENNGLSPGQFRRQFSHSI